MRVRSLLALVLLCFLTGIAAAHDLGIECELAGESVEVRAFFTDGVRAGGAKVRFLDALGQLVAEGKLNDKGVWLTPRPAPGVYAIVVDAGQGHKKRTQVIIPSADRAAGRISEGLGEDEFTAFPWLKIAIGLALLGMFGLGAWLATRGKATRGQAPHGS